MTRLLDNWMKIGIILLSLYIISQITSIFLPILASIVLTFILNPVVNYFCTLRVGPGKWQINRSIAVFLAFLCFVLVLGIIATFVLFPFISEFNKFVLDLPSLLEKLDRITTEFGQFITAAPMPARIASIVEQVSANIAAILPKLASDVASSLLTFATRTIELVVVPILTYYFLKDWQALRESFLTIFKAKSRGKIGIVIDEMAFVVSGYIRGQFIVSIVIGAMVFCGMYFLDVGYPLVLGLLATLTESVPIIGPIIGAVPAIILAYLVEPALAFKVLLFFIVIHQVENNIVVPKVMGHTIALHPAIIIISLLVGGKLFGIPGMILAVPVTALLRVLLKHIWFHQ